MHLTLLLFLAFVESYMCLDLKQFHEYLSREDSSNSECEEQKNSFLEGLTNAEEWALGMLDSYGRIPQAIMQGNNMDIGTVDQCLYGDVKGRYCLAGLVLPVGLLENISLPFENVVLMKRNGLLDNVDGIDEIDLSKVLLLSACVPDACYPSDFFGLLGFDGLCVTVEEAKSLRSGDIAFMIFAGTIFLMVVTSAIYDLYLKKQSKKTIHEILLAFSAYTNGKRIINVTQQPGQISFFNGLKVISMFWIILGHRFAASVDLIVNKADATEWRQTGHSGYVSLAPLAVDTFFFISGALLAYAFLKTVRKTDRKFNIFLYYLHRILRLTPALAALFFFYLTWSQRLSVVPEGLDTTSACRRNWWSFFLYIQNYVAPSDLCLVHTWYLSVDMQFFILSPLLLLPTVLYGKKFAYTVLPVLIILSLVANVVLFLLYDMEYDSELYQHWNYSTHGRIPQWCLGILFGVFILDYNENKRKYLFKNKIMVFSIWATVFGVIVVMFYFFQDVAFRHSALKSALYFPTQKVAWCLCLWWLSFSCVIGDVGFINWFLSLPVFQVLSRITYSTYLVHVVIQVNHIKLLRQLVYFNDYEMIRNAIADIVLSYALGAVWALMFEYPVIVLEHVILGRTSHKSVKYDQKTDGKNLKYPSSSNLDEAKP